MREKTPHSSLNRRPCTREIKEKTCKEKTLHMYFERENPAQRKSKRKPLKRKPCTAKFKEKTFHKEIQRGNLAQGNLGNLAQDNLKRIETLHR